MPDWALAIVVKPFIALLFMLLVWIIAAVIHKVMPDCKLKRILFSPLPGHRKR